MTQHQPIDPADIADFTPAPSRARHDGWTAERQRSFILALAESGCVSHAAEVSGMTPRSAYRLRSRNGADAFARAWDEALTLASHRLLAVAFDRAINGNVRRRYVDGKLVSEEHVPSDRLLVFLLTHMDAMRFGDLRNVPFAMANPLEQARGRLDEALDALEDSAVPAEPITPADYLPPDPDDMPPPA